MRWNAGMKQERILHLSRGANVPLPTRSFSRKGDVACREPELGVRRDSFEVPGQMRSARESQRNGVSPPDFLEFRRLTHCPQSLPCGLRKRPVSMRASPPEFSPMPGPKTCAGPNPAISSSADIDGGYFCPPQGVSPRRHPFSSRKPAGVRALPAGIKASFSSRFPTRCFHEAFPHRAAPRTCREGHPRQQCRGKQVPGMDRHIRGLIGGTI